MRLAAIRAARRIFRRYLASWDKLQKRKPEISEGWRDPCPKLAPPTGGSTHAGFAVPDANPFTQWLVFDSVGTRWFLSGMFDENLNKFCDTEHMQPFVRDPPHPEDEPFRICAP